MTPYYQADGVAIYHGDCAALLAELPRVDLVLTDPPYGMNYKPLRGANGSYRWKDGVVGDKQPFNPAPLLELGRCVLFGANWYAERLPPSGGWVVWDKTPRGAKTGFYASHAELAWTNCAGSIRKFSMQWGGEARGGEPFYHPTQKPVELAAWCLAQFSRPGALILDPYMGAGWVLEAAKRMKRRAIGVEIEEKYCEAAAARLSQQLLDIELPDEAAAASEADQAALWS